MTNLLKGTSIFLIGMMGTGKTTVGQHLAKQINYRFFDSDVLIEKVVGQTINDIFATQGEEQFRQIETQVLRELASYTRSVIATGGGIILRQENWSYLHHGLIVWLDAPVDLLAQRLAEDNTRPLLKETNPKQRLELLLSKRKPLYAQADLHILIEQGQTPEQIVDKILETIPTVLKPQTLPPEMN